MSLIPYLLVAGYGVLITNRGETYKTKSEVAFSCRPSSKPSGVELHKDDIPFVDIIAEELGLKKLRVVETGGNAYMHERTQWDSGANLVSASPECSLCL